MANELQVTDSIKNLRFNDFIYMQFFAEYIANSVTVKGE